MITLLKADLKRMLKDKLFMVACIIGGGFALMTPILFYALEWLLGIDDSGMAGVLVNARTVLTNSFAPLNNFGLILPIFLGIIIHKDFSNGTVRNKIICGKPRYQIYLSILISSIIVMLICVLGYAIIGFGVGSVLLEYSSTVTIGEDIGFILLTLLFGSICYSVLASMIVFLFVNMKNMGVGAVLYFAIAFVLTLLSTVLVFAIDYLVLANGDTTLTEVLKVICNLNIFHIINNIIVAGVEYGTKDIIYIIIDFIVYLSMFTGFGILIFSKKDLK
jgi:hypothetical protein